MGNFASGTRQITTLIEHVDKDAASQTLSSNQIAKAILLLENATHQTAAMAEENASAGTELQQQAALMRDAVRSLEALV